MFLVLWVFLVGILIGFLLLLRILDHSTAHVIHLNVKVRVSFWLIYFSNWVDSKIYGVFVCSLLTVLVRDMREGWACLGRGFRTLSSSLQEGGSHPWLLKITWRALTWVSSLETLIKLVWGGLDFVKLSWFRKVPGNPNVQSLLIITLPISPEEKEPLCLFPSFRLACSTFQPEVRVCCS